MGSMQQVLESEDVTTSMRRELGLLVKGRSLYMCL